MKKVLIIIFFVSVLISSAYAHSGKPEHYVIIDTDCAIDDFRAITMLLASSKVEVLGITTSDGTLSPAEGLKRVVSLLKCFHHEGIPVAGGEETIESPPNWRDLNNKLSWADEPGSDNNIYNLSAINFIIETISNEKNPVTVICMGSLTNIARAIQKADSIGSNIKRIIWYNRNNDIINGTNYRFDIPSANHILNSGINIDIVSNPDIGRLMIDKVLLDSISVINSIYARQITCVHNQDELENFTHKGYMNIRDDLVPLYLLSPAAFRTDSTKEYPYARLVNPVDMSGIKKQITDILDIEKHLEGKVFAGFPVDPSLYREDVAEVMNELISKHGLSEWRLGVLTNELHGHLGIYAVVGVKMGLRAREYFNIGLDDINVVSYAGRKPPISCMNDGLQVSTGATLGHGLIYLTDESRVMPMAVFSYKNRTVILKLKDEYLNIVKKDISECISEHHNLTREYWECVRKRAIDYWLAWDRNIMFNLQ
jgi:pyrimidine-specific ribonucleoside hydrolase